MWVIQGLRLRLGRVMLALPKKLEGGLAGRLAGLRPQDCEVWVLVFGFLGYFLWQWTQNVVAGGLVGDLGGADVVAIYAEA